MPVDDLSDDLVARLSEVIAESLGLHFPPERHPDLKRALLKAAAQDDLSSLSKYVRWILSSQTDRALVDDLAPHLTIGETHFFRDERLFRALEKVILPDIWEKCGGNPALPRIWSAGCSTGEEPYSIAIAMARVFPFSILPDEMIIATDVNSGVIEKARKATYSQWSFRGVPDQIQESYFVADGNGLQELVPHIRKLVWFGRHNLAGDAFPPVSAGPGQMDLIFCRNVLMYFDPKRVREVVRRLGDCLKDGGWIVVAPAEADLVSDKRLVPVNLPGVIVFKKDERSERPGRTWFVPPEESVGQPSVNPFLNLVLDEPALDANDNTMGLPSPVGMLTAVLDVPPLDATPEPETAPPEEASTPPVRPVEPEEYSLEHLAAMARSKADEGKLDEALEYCEKAMTRNKLSPECHYLHGVILQEQGRVSEAAAAMRKAVYLDPKMALAHFALGNLSRAQGRAQESNKHFGAALAALSSYQSDDTLLESEGLTAGRLKEIIRKIVKQET